MIPKFDEIQVQALKELKDGEVKEKKALHDPLAKHYKLTDEELNKKYDSGLGL